MIKKAGVEMPSRRELLAASICNPHGFGFVTKKTCFKTTSFEEFYNELKKVKTSEACIIHMRYATHGSVKAENCHPFHCNGVFFAHNGVLPIASKNDMTDSEIAFREMFMPVINKYGFKSKKLNEEVEKIIGWSKFAFMKDGHIRAFGNFTEHNGVLYSNTRHFSLMPKETKRKGSMSWDEYLRIRYA